MPRGGHRQGAGRKSSWKHGKTTVIRVPEIFARRLLDIAQKLDSGECIEYVSKSKEFLDSPQEVDVVPGQMSLLDFDTVCSSKAEISFNNAQLARRFGIHPTSLSKYRRNHSAGQLAAWSATKDPENLAWSYDPQKRLYMVVSDFVAESNG